MKLTLLAGLFAISAWAAPTTYYVTTQNYSVLKNNTTCNSGPCAQFTTSMNITGSITLANALPPNNLGAGGGTDLSSQVVAYSFSDGLSTYSNTDPSCRIVEVFIATDGSGNLTSITNIVIMRWLSGTNGAHVLGDRLARVFVPAGTGQSGLGTYNARCITVSNFPPSHIPDTCVITADVFTDQSSATAPGVVWTTVPPATPIPSSVWMLATGLAALIGWQALRRRSAA